MLYVPGYARYINTHLNAQQLFQIRDEPRRIQQAPPWLPGNQQVEVAVLGSLISRYRTEHPQVRGTAQFRQMNFGPLVSSQRGEGHHVFIVRQIRAGFTVWQLDNPPYSRAIMTRTITIRLTEEHYGRIKAAAEADNRTISNFIHTATLRFIEQSSFCDETEMAEITEDAKLLKSLNAGSLDASKGRFAIVQGGPGRH